jgi:hypothetical protein
MTAWSILRGETIWFDDHTQHWRYTNGDPVTNFVERQRSFWDVQWTANPWFSLGIHIDHHAPYIALHLPGVIIAFGNTGYPGFGRGLRAGKVFQ